MKRVIIIGCPGSGKSTFSRALHRATGIPVYHLDNMHWNPDRTVVPKPVFRERLHQTLQKEAWIIDGNYGSTLEIRLQACDTVIFLDYPLEVCLDGILSRRGKERTDMPWVEPADEVDEEFIQFVKDYPAVSRPKVMELLSSYAQKEIHIFKNREEANQFIEQISQSTENDKQNSGEAYMTTKIYEINTLQDYKYVVILSEYQGKILLSRHKDRSTWETQGGHIEQGETPIEAAKRELFEESGAIKYAISPLCDYWAGNEGTDNWANGMVFTAKIEELAPIPDCEMAEVKTFEVLPDNLTYPDITPVLFEYLTGKSLNP